MGKPIVKVKKLHPDAVLPRYATKGASGFDLVALEDVAIAPQETKLIKTGLSMEITEGYELQVRPRSGLSLKTYLRIANSPGSVDSDYRGEICVIMTNSWPHSGSRNDFKEYIKKGDRIAQGMICPVEQAELVLADELSDTERGSGGFGSTGK
jgi:dUTP pyrophosphatase